MAERTRAAATAATETADGQEAAPETKACPNCSGALGQHPADDPLKAGAWHCNTCGACWLPDLSDVREGTPLPSGWPKE